MDIDLSFRPGEGLPYVEHDRLRARGRVVWSDVLGGWAVSAYDDVMAVISDPTRFTSEGTPIGEAFGAEAMLVNDTPLHHTMRAVWAKHVSKSAMAARDGRLQQIAVKLLEPICSRLKSGATLNLTGVFDEFVSEVIAVMFEMPRERLADLERWHRIMFSGAATIGVKEGSPRYAEHLAAKAEVYDFLHNQMNRRRERLLSGEEPDDLISLMVAAEGRDGITRSAAVDNLMNFFLGALDTTTKWLGNISVVLHRHPHVLEEIRADRGLLPQAIEEVMRLETVAQMLVRLVRNDGTELAGQTLKARDRVFAFLGAANRDPTAFEDPGVFDIHRISKPHLGFGFGMHHCLGANIARQDALSFINVFLDMFSDLEIAADYGNSWAAWGPHSLQIRLPSGGDG